MFVRGGLIFVVCLAAAATVSVQGQQLTKTNPMATATTASNLPLYWGFFLKDTDTKEYLDISFNLLSETMKQVPDFYGDLQNFTGQTSIEDVLNYYTRTVPDDVLHCTCMYNGVYPDYSPGAEEYANKAAVKVCLSEIN